MNTVKDIPKVYQEFCDYWVVESQKQICLEKYQTGQQSFVPNLLPEQAIQFSGLKILDILRGTVGEEIGYCP